MKLQLEGSGVGDRWNQTNKSETIMFPIYGNDRLNLNMPNIWNTKISYGQMVIMPPLLQVWKKVEEAPNRVPRTLWWLYGEVFGE